ncbi:MAG: hypothetical protein QW739_02260, partial [Candidatus Odinarchaeota archaeon]
MRIILHVDLDYFFAQVEEREDPNLKGKPVVVCVYSDRGGGSGVVAAANYTARRYNVKAGLPIRIAEKRLTGLNAVFLPVRKEYYESVSDEVMNIVKKYGDVFEQASIDEAYLDATSMLNGFFDKSYGHAINLQSDVYLRTGLTCSIGVSYNKLLAKIAAGFRKPNGVTVVKPGESEEFLKTQGIKLFRTDRGGKATYHGPGQLIIYPVLNLSHFNFSGKYYVNKLEQVVINWLQAKGIQAQRDPDYPGVWVGEKK